MKYVLTIDLGTSGPKVALFDENISCIDYAFKEVELILSEGGGAEQRPSDWTEAISYCIVSLLQKNGIPATDILAINCSSQWSGTIPLDAEGTPLHNAIIWMDSRGADEVKNQVGGFPEVEGYRIDNIIEFIRLTGGAPGKTGKDPVGHILYLKHRLPHVYAKANKVVEPKDYLNFWLSGKLISSYDCITLHWCTDNRDIHNIKYHNGLLKRTGLDREKLLDLVPANSVLGTVRTEIAEKFGLSPQTVVVSGTPDVHAAAVGSGAVNDFETHLYIGTSSWLVCHVPFKKTDLLHNMATIPSAIPGRYLVANEQETTGACLNFLKNNLFYPKDDISNEEAPADFYQRLDKLAEKSPAGSNGLIFFPWLYGERSPMEDHHVRGGFFNLSLQHTRADWVRAVYEGIAMNTRWLLVYVEKMVGKRLESVNFIGGGARSDIWCQIIADVYNRPIKQLADPITAGSRGVALLAWQAIGKIDYSDFGKNVEIKKIYMPNPHNKTLYNERFAIFMEHYKLNQKLWKKLNP